MISDTSRGDKEFASRSAQDIEKRVQAKYERFSMISLIVFDFDGVMTDNSVMVFQDGTEAVVCSREDGMGITLLQEAGWQMLVLSSERNPVVQARCDKLRLPCIHGVKDKLQALIRYAEAAGLQAVQIAYVGNDLNDEACMRWAGLPIAVSDATPSILGLASHVTTRPGGRGAVREIADIFLLSGSRGTQCV